MQPWSCSRSRTTKLWYKKKLTGAENTNRGGRNAPYRKVGHLSCQVATPKTLAAVGETDPIVKWDVFSTTDLAEKPSSSGTNDTHRKVGGFFD